MSCTDSASSSHGGEYKNFRQITRDSKFLSPGFYLVWVIDFVCEMYHMYEVIWFVLLQNWQQRALNCLDELGIAGFYVDPFSLCLLMD